MKSSVRVRFAFTVGANLFRSLLSFAAGMLLARWLGPTRYGNMAFLVGTFSGLRQLLDMGSSTAFFTFLSQRARTRRFVLSYMAWLSAQFIVPLFVIAVFFPGSWVETIWRGEPRSLVLLALSAAFMQNNAWPIVQQAGESQRQTLWVQGVGVAVAAAHLAAVVLLWAMGALGLYAVFAVITVEYAIAGVVAHRRFAYAPAASDVTGGVRESILPMYLRYCLPLVPYSAVGFAYEFADRWLLQKYGGSVEQAYYAVGAQLSAIALLATTSILRIFWKEVAEAHHLQDHERTGRLYQKVSRLLFLVGAISAGFLMPWSAEILRLMLGPAYAAGALTLGIMFLYPVHQSIGQINGTMLYATQRVTLQVVSGIVSMIASMAVTYFVLAPRTAIVPGLGLGSEGLALKMVVMQVLTVNAVSFLIARIWLRPFDWVYQPVGLLGCVAFGEVARFAAVRLVAHLVPAPVVIGVGGVFYTLLIIPFIYGMPWLAGLTRPELMADVRYAWQGTARLFHYGR